MAGTSHTTNLSRRAVARMLSFVPLAVAPIAIQAAHAEPDIEVLKAQLGEALAKKWGRPVFMSEIGSNGQCAPGFVVRTRA